MNPHRSSEPPAAPQNFRKSFMRMASVLVRPELKRWRFRIIAALFITIIAKGLAVIAPVLLGNGINQITSGGLSAQDIVRGAGISFAGFIGLFGLARFLSNGLPQLRDAFFSTVTQDANRLVAVEAFAHAQHQSLQFHLTRRAGALNRIIERGAGAIDFMLRFLAFNIGPTIVELMFAAVVMTVLYSWKLSAAAVVTVIVYATFTIVVTEWRNKLRRAMNEADTELRAISMDTLTNFETVKSFAAEDREAGRFNTAMQFYNLKYVRTMQSMNLLNTGQELIMTGGLVAVAIIAGLAYVDGQLQAGDITAVILMLSNIYRPLTILGFAWREIKQGAVDIEKLYGLMDKSPEVADVPNAIELKADKGVIEFKDLEFSHEGRRSGLDNINLSLNGGTFVGLVGPSGSGKTTILKLLFRMYDPSAGSVMIDGQDISKVTQSSLRRTMGIVPQEVVLFNDTLRFNLAYAIPDSSDAEIMKAAERAQLGPFISGLADGLDTRVGERGMKLSGGEKQRVGIARAILLDPKILVLDEATSSLDSDTEKEVQSALKEAAKGRTTIAVAHRLSTISDADQIIVLDQGKIVESGSHNSLLMEGGVYSTLWTRQSNAPETTAEIKNSHA